MDDVMKLRREAEDEAGEDLVGAIAVVPRDVLLEGDVVELVGVAVNRAGRARPIVLDLERGTAVVLDESDHFVDASAIVRELRAL